MNILCEMVLITCIAAASFVAGMIFRFNQLRKK
jgi:hypothetical protein